jgi:hypothetical protein
MCEMDGSESLGQERLDGLSEQLIQGIPKHDLGMVIYMLNAPVLSNDQHSVGKRIQQVTKFVRDVSK